MNSQHNPLGPFSRPTPSPKRPAGLRWLLALLASGALVGLGAPEARAAGFEIPENTTKSVARGGTGAVNKSDPSALYFNPALLPRSRGFQALLNVNFVNLNLDFQRAPLVTEPGSRREETHYFDPVNNSAGFFPAPFLTLSWDLGIEDFALGLGLFGPSGYSERCFGEMSDGKCQAHSKDSVAEDQKGAARYMMVGSELIEVFGSLGAGYTLRLPKGELSVGATGMLTYLDTDFTLAIHGTPAEEQLEAAKNDAIFHGNKIRDWALTGTFGLAYALEGWRAAASYRLPISWDAEGSGTMESAIAGAELTDDKITLGANQAGVLRAGVGYEGGEHPGIADRPRYDIELNFVWEDWSRLQHFRIHPSGDLALGDERIDLGTLYQPKNFQDAFSFRLGGSYAFLPWLSAHLGGFYETGAQPDAYTNVDFVSWDRFAGGLGATFHLFDQLDVDIAYQHIISPDRTVTDGKVHQQVPLASCQGPNYDSEYCNPKGLAPGNPQNNGQWSASFQTASIGLTYYYD